MIPKKLKEKISFKKFMKGFILTLLCGILSYFTFDLNKTYLIISLTAFPLLGGIFYSLFNDMLYLT